VKRDKGIRNGLPVIYDATKSIVGWISWRPADIIGS